jgi:hypothetical protein
MWSKEGVPMVGERRFADTTHPEHEWFRGLAERHLQRALQ